MSRIDSDDFSKNATSFDEALCQAATFADLDMEQVEAFLQEDRVHRQEEYRSGYSVQQQMEALGLARGEHPSNGALLCFGRNPSQQIACAYMRCIYTSYSGHLEDKEYRVSLLKQFTEARELLQKHLNFGRMIERGGSSEQPEFPPGVLEEALTNALIHCEYVTLPDHISRVDGVTVEISRDHVKISNPSGLQPASHPRNPQIMRIFYLAGYIESAGEGIAQMHPADQLTYFRLSTTDDREGRAAADFFAGQHYHKVLLLKDDSDVYSFGLAQVFQQEWRQLGGSVTPLELSESASTIQDYQNTLQTVASLQPDLIYFSGNDPNGTYVLQALSNVPQLKSVTFAGGDGITDSSFLQAAAQLHHSTPIYATLSIQDPGHSGQAVG